MGLTHINERGEAIMVDVSGKTPTKREAAAVGRIRMNPDCFALVTGGGTAKGDVLGAARIAGVFAAKRTADLIPLCHPLALSSCTMAFTFCADTCEIEAVCAVACEGKTGAEMEALTGVSVALLTIYDMCKAADKRMVIHDIHLREKRGGKSGDFTFEGGGHG